MSVYSPAKITLGQSVTCVDVYTPHTCISMNYCPLLLYVLRRWSFARATCVSQPTSDYPRVYFTQSRADTRRAESARIFLIFLPPASYVDIKPLGRILVGRGRYSTHRIDLSLMQHAISARGALRRGYRREKCLMIMLIPGRWRREWVLVPAWLLHCTQHVLLSRTMLSHVWSEPPVKVKINADLILT